MSRSSDTYVPGWHPAFVDGIDANGNHFGRMVWCEPEPERDPELVRIGREARAIRFKANKILRDVADDMGVSVVDVSSFEHGKRAFDDAFRDRYYEAVWREKLEARS